MAKDWPKFVSHKTVQAVPITRIDPPIVEGALPVLFVDPYQTGEHEVFSPTEPKMATRCVVGDLAMRYRDGYCSVCPKKEFEDGYSPKEEGA